MKARVILPLLMLTLCGCRTPPACGPAELGDGFRREGHPSFSSQEQKVVTAARQCIEQTSGRHIDAYYRVRHTSEGYSVLAFEVYRYEGNQPKFTIGRDWGVDLKEDGTVKHIVQLNE